MSSMTITEVITSVPLILRMQNPFNFEELLDIFNELFDILEEYESETDQISLRLSERAENFADAAELAFRGNEQQKQVALEHLVILQSELQGIQDNNPFAQALQNWVGHVPPELTATVNPLAVLKRLKDEEKESNIRNEQKMQEILRTSTAAIQKVKEEAESKAEALTQEVSAHLRKQDENLARSLTEIKTSFQAERVLFNAEVANANARVDRVIGQNAALQQHCNGITNQLNATLATNQQLQAQVQELANKKRGGGCIII